MWYDLSISRLTALLLPTFLRGPRMRAWMDTLHAPLEPVLREFQAQRRENLRSLQANGQVCYLRAILNERFDLQQRRIRITDGNRYRRPYIYTVAQNLPKSLGIIYLRSDADYGDTGVDFIVELNGAQADPEHLKMKIEENKLASKRYKIV